MTKDQVLIRAKDVTLMISIITLLGLVIVPVKKIFKFDETIEKVAKLETKQETMQAAQIVTDRNLAVVSAQYAEIGKQLDQINWQLRRMRDDRR